MAQVGVESQLELKWDAGTITDRLGAASSSLDSLLDKYSGASKAVLNLAKGAKIFATAFPVAAIVLDILLGAPAPDPKLQEISNKIDELSGKMDRYQQQNMMSFDNIRTDICVSEMQDEVSLLTNLDLALKGVNGTYNPYLINPYCGSDGGRCQTAFDSIADALPLCAEKMIESSYYTQDGLALKGYVNEYNKITGFYLSVLATAYKNLLWLNGKRMAMNVGTVKSLDDING
jgi:hypothetical protein